MGAGRILILCLGGVRGNLTFNCARFVTDRVIFLQDGTNVIARRLQFISTHLSHHIENDVSMSRVSGVSDIFCSFRILRSCHTGPARKRYCQSPFWPDTQTPQTVRQGRHPKSREPARQWGPHAFWVRSIGPPCARLGPVVCSLALSGALSGARRVPTIVAGARLVPECLHCMLRWLRGT